jgi:hypothetical protein
MAGRDDHTQTTRSGDYVEDENIASGAKTKRGRLNPTDLRCSVRVFRSFTTTPRSWGSLLVHRCDHDSDTIDHAAPQWVASSTTYMRGAVGFLPRGERR